MKHSQLIFLFTALIACLVQAQQFNRPIGQYPGNPSEYYGPVIMNGQGRCTFEYLSKFHTVYQSSSWDYNLTSQLLTDGIIDEHDPAWLNVTTPEGPLPPHKREACIDGNEWTNNILMGGNTWLQYDWEGMAIDIDEVEMVCNMAYREDAPKGFKIRLFISKDGKKWKVADEWKGDSLPGEPSWQRAHSDPNKNSGDDLLPTRKITHTFHIKKNKKFSHMRLEMVTPAAAHWTITELKMRKDGKRARKILPSEQFVSAWRSLGIENEWVTVDLGAQATINGIGDYAGTNTVTFRVEPADAAVRIVTPPTAISGLTYNGQAQVLITAGEAEGGVMLYRLENEEYSTELPTAISAGTYTVYYKAHSDDNHLDTSEQSLVAQIAPATGSWDGEGTAEVPYLIKSVLDMNLIALKQNEMDYTGVYFRLENDLDYTDAELLPIGTLQRRFNGNFNGNGHTFTNLIINKPGETNVAIFAIVGNNGVINDLHLGEGCVITGGSCVGAFAGLFSGTISNCTTAPGVIVSSNHEVGGIVGRCVGKIDHCVNQASVITDNNEGNTAGGIAGSAYSTQSAASDISNNLNLGSVEAVNMVGGIVGYNGTTYTNNYYAGDCNVGGINGRDRDNQAQRGYTITGGNDVVVELIDDATVGLTFNGIVYAGAKQQVILKLSVSQNGAQHAPILRTGAQTSFIVSSGSLVDNGDGTWTLTMPETGEDVTISIDDTSTSITDIDADKPRSSQRYDLTGKPVGSSYRGIVIERSAEGRLQCKKIIVK